ncbi:uncharacterized protein LOC127364475 [Dicentrarchus labrax]|uniref:uncharacterized protein LOC127364475 n=1 Tax=Dicentrarchus labrax TaxID=13489 RepID=UPI0021F63051|nr:uncharacterized protein LOC127364475 [Dicentrarchus labrax]
MNGLLVLLYCIEILGPLLCGAQTNPDNSSYYIESVSATSQDDSANASSSTPGSYHLPTTSTAVSKSSKSPTTSPSPFPQSTTQDTKNIFFSKDCLPVLMVTGGLIIACTILLVSTLLLAWKVCHLSRRIKALSSNADLISNPEYFMGNDKKNKSKPEETEAKETSVLMSDISQSQEERGNGTTKEEGEKVNEDEKMGEEKKKEVEDTANGEEASTTPVAEGSSPPKPQEEATDSQPTPAVAAPTSEGTEEPKDVV